MITSPDLNKPFDCKGCGKLLSIEDVKKLRPTDYHQVCLTCREKGYADMEGELPK